jgi:hypothetical protein
MLMSEVDARISTAAEAIFVLATCFKIWRTSQAIKLSHFERSHQGYSLYSGATGVPLKIPHIDSVG